MVDLHSCLITASCDAPAAHPANSPAQRQHSEPNNAYNYTLCSKLLRNAFYESVSFRDLSEGQEKIGPTSTMYTASLFYYFQ